MDNVLVVVYSWTGTSHRLAEAMAASRQWTLAEIREARPGRTPLRCILDSLLRRRPAILYDGPDPSRFDAVVLVSPVWAGRLAGPMRSFVAERARSLPHAAVVTVMGSSSAPAALVEMSGLLQRAPIVDAAFKQREIEDGACAAQLEALGKAVETALRGGPRVLRPAFGSGI